MLVDYLRYLAFSGRLRPFFEEGLYNYVDPSVTTGQHLRFAADYLDDRLRYLRRMIRSRRHWGPQDDDERLLELKQVMGLTGGPDNLATLPPFQIGDPPSTFIYKENQQLRLEIIIDVDPVHWTSLYSEPRSYEGTPIIFRRAGAAKADFRSGDKLVAHQRSGYGTLCGIFHTSNGASLALTCGHVAAKGSHVLVERQRRIWKLPLNSLSTPLGEVLYATLCPSAKGLPVQKQLDAALIAIEPAHLEEVQQATIKPISAVLQEEPVCFRGSGRAKDTLARVSAVTVRKSIDLLRDGVLRDVGDVLMLGHRQPMYIVQRVSRPGDSGAAVRQDYSPNSPSSELSQWHGMILGCDEGGAYATYAEHLWAWAAQETGDQGIEFAFEG